ncbi:MAG: enoyl-CoA hydratase-related protein [Acidimicrobiales bacterium]|jgi:enoyl-CoA hydratase/carnithine racemase|nr:enoyl-CoA hydratase [Acidimicrobiaceae bacterium]MDP6976351.1 enoyl-CoA hydratase-related protein [Acidimicrobiales bacterium]
MELKAIRCEDVGTTRVVLLSRPHRRNAWTGRMHTEYRWTLEQAEADDAVKVVLVTGDPEGGAFSVGADSGALEGHAERGGYDPGTPDDLPMPGYGVHPAFDADFAWHFGLTKPVVAAINGAAAGVGLVVACFADLRFAASGSKLTTAFGKLGLPAEYGLSWLLPRLIGLGRANDLLLTSRVVLAEEALDLGLVNGVVPGDDLLPHVHGWIDEFLGPVARSSLAAAKRQTYTDLHRDAASAIGEAVELLDVHTAGPDYAEGVAALTERRPPHFP